MKEIPLKRWFFEEAKRTGVSHWAIQKRFYLGFKDGYPHLKLRIVNQRVIFVQQ